MGRKSTTGGVTPAGERIQIEFTWRGKRLRPTLPLRPTQANLKAAARLREQIMREIAVGTFDLRAHFPDYRRADQLAPPPAELPTFRRAADLWLRLLQVEHSTRVGYRKNLAHYWLPHFGERPIASITLEDLVERLSMFTEVDRPISRKTRNNILVSLRGAFRAARAQQWIERDPTELIENARVQKALPDPFSLAEVEAILAGLSERAGAEVADYYEFAFFAGLRTSEQIALRWADVDLRQMSVRIHRSRAERQDKESTKTHRERTVELNARAAAVIRCQEARTRLAGGHVFLDPATGKPWHDNQAPWKPWAAIIRKLGVRYRPPKECRDTSVTLALQAGADPVWVAAQHGHSLAVMMRDYARWIPDGDRGRNRGRVDAALGFAGGTPVKSDEDAASA